MNWEYKVLSLQCGLEAGEFPPKWIDQWEPPLEILNRMSQDHWELVSVGAYPDSRGGLTSLWWKEYYFRRAVTKP